jgi:hypothetical protein
MKNLKLLVITSLALMIVLCETVHARMYQWTEPETGSTQLSGKPPVWYRSESGGPRVFVFDNGRLIDDTAIEVDDEVRESMRQQAFVLVEEDRQKARDKIAKSLELKQNFVKEKAVKIEEPDLDDMEQEPPVPELVADETALDESFGDDQNSDVEKTTDELRKLIEAWDKAKTENAKKALEQ